MQENLDEDSPVSSVFSDVLRVINRKVVPFYNFTVRRPPVVL